MTSAFKNQEKARKRRKRGAGPRDPKYAPKGSPPAAGKTARRAVNFYGHFSPGRAAKLRRLATRIKRAEVEGGQRAVKLLMERIYGRLPLWLRRRVVGR